MTTAEKALNDYYSAKQAKVRAEEYLNGAYSSIKKAREDLEGCNATIKNVEKRLSDVNGIISMFKGDITSCIEKADRTANSSNEKYISAIKCDQVVMASVAFAFRSKSVSDDTDSSFAYQSLEKEKARLERQKSELEKEIHELCETISELEGSIKRYNSLVQSCAEAMSNSLKLIYGN